MESNDWLSLTQEEAIEPEIPICDSHHHLWYHDETDYHVDHFLHDAAGGHRILQTVFVESRMMLRKDGPEEMKPVGETEYVQRVVANCKNGSVDVAAGIVGFADLTLGAAVDRVLEAHLAAGKGRFRGIRSIGTWDASSAVRSRAPRGLYRDAGFQEGFSRLAKHGLSFDACIYHPQLPDLLDLAGRFPDTTIILEHMGMPVFIGPYSQQRDKVLQDWQQSIAALAALPNLFIKLGGIGMPILGQGWHQQAAPPTSAVIAEAMKPYFSWCLEHFGVKRCMFESNFPPDKRSCSYTVLWNAFKRLTQGMAPDEWVSLFAGTAVQVYRLPSPIKHAERQ